MDDAHFDDLKQFIDTRISQTEELLRKEMNDGFAGIADVVEGINHRDDKQDKRIGKLDKRVRRLEKATA